MPKFLILDIGAGTLDILFYDTDTNLHYKAVVRSPVSTVADEAALLPGDLLVVGTEMGGGAVAQVLRRRAQEGRVVMSRSAAPTVHHNLERVVSQGIEVVEDAVAEELRRSPGFSVLTLGDLEAARVKRIVEGMGIPFSFHGIGICAQDHGVAPEGMSHLDYRHSLFKASLECDPFPHSLLFRAQELPGTFSRLTAICRSASALPAEEIFVMDSGMAAVLGASLDIRAAGKQRILTLDVATSHTVGAVLEDGELCGFFEYHTEGLTRERLAGLVTDLADGNLTHGQILAEGGHGAYIRRAPGFGSMAVIVATGPKRGLVGGIQPPWVYGGPLGDNMMTGTAGVLEAIRRRMGLPPIPYL
ncbi:MAG: DUF1786 family protein [Thermodesulfobacteriota bacterium]